MKNISKDQAKPKQKREILIPVPGTGTGYRYRVPVPEHVLVPIGTDIGTGKWS